MGVNRNAIASALGISPTTVTRALNDSSLISKATKDKVIAKAKELEYVPSRIGKSYYQKKSFQIGVLLPLLDSKMSNVMIEYYTHCVSGLSVKALEYDYSVCIIVDQDMAYEELKGMVLSKKIDALVFLDGQSDDDRQKKLIEDNIPIVSIGHYPPDVSVPTVVNDYSVGFVELLQLVESDVPYEILFIRDSFFNRDVEKIEHDLDSVVQASGSSIKKIMVASEQKIEWKDIKTYISGCRRTLIICANDIVGMEVINSLTSSHVKVGDNVKIVGCNNIFASKFVKPSLTTINSSRNLMGRTAIEVLMTYKNEGKINYIELPTRIYRGESC